MNHEQYVKEYMRFIIQDICMKIGPRPPCSPEETQCAEYFAKELNKYTNLTYIESFHCHPGSYRAQYQFPIWSVIIVTVFYWIYFFIHNTFFLLSPLIILLCTVVVIQTNIMRNKEFIDPLFKRANSTNVYGVFKPQNEPIKRIVIGGHHDSNWEFPILRKSWKVFGVLMALPIILNHLLVIIFCVKLIFHLFSNPYLIMIEIDLIILTFLTGLFPILIYFTFHIVSTRPVMGANDNLSALAVILALARDLPSLNLKTSEVWFVSHGCEEIGVRGSKRFATKHYKDLEEALVINLDMLGGPHTQLRFVTAEVHFLIKLSKAIVKLLGTIADTLDIPYHINRIDAFTDSSAYIQRGIKACSIIGFPQKGVPPYYHTREDILANLTFENLWHCYQILRYLLIQIDTEENFIYKNV
ncbi:MAG: M28 family metallopeptidase [Candidatus Helarchaeota archaeon]